MLKEGEWSALMSEDNDTLLPRVRRLVDAFNETDLVRLRISDEAENSIELRRASRPPMSANGSGGNGAIAAEHVVMQPVDVIKSDLVGIAYLSKPAPTPGTHLEGDRELAYVEALGIRNSVRSLGGGRLVAVLVDEGDPVEYGQPLFEIERV